jgi:uncharacterized Zn finger protein
VILVAGWHCSCPNIRGGDRAHACKHKRAALAHINRVSKQQADAARTRASVKHAVDAMLAKVRAVEASL